MFPITATLSVALQPRRLHGTLQIFDGTALLLTIGYQLEDRVVAPEEDFTPFVEDGDFDFGLWLSNVFKNEQRQKVCLETWSDGASCAGRR